MATHRKHIRSKIKAEIALKALESPHAVPLIAEQYQVKPEEVEQWRDRIRAAAPDLFHDDISRRHSKRKKEKLSQYKRRIIYAFILLIATVGIVKLAVNMAMSGVTPG